MDHGVYAEKDIGEGEGRTVTGLVKCYMVSYLPWYCDLCLVGGGI